MSTPKPGWTLEAAVGLLQDGYAAEQVERMTGFHARHVEAAAAAQAKERRPAGHGVVTPPAPAPAPEPAEPQAEPEPFWPHLRD